MTNVTHRTRLARLVAIREEVPYTKALRLVKDAARSGALPRNLEDLEAAAVLVSLHAHRPATPAVRPDPLERLWSFINPGSAFERNLPPAIALVGPPGSGKSVLGDWITAFPDRPSISLGYDFSSRPLAVRISPNALLTEGLTPDRRVGTPAVHLPLRTQDSLAHRTEEFARGLLTASAASTTHGSLARDIRSALAAGASSWEEVLEALTEPDLQHQLQTITHTLPFPVGLAMRQLFAPRTLMPRTQFWGWRGLQIPLEGTPRSQWTRAECAGMAVRTFLYSTAQEALQGSGGILHFTDLGHLVDHPQVMDILRQARSGRIVPLLEIQSGTRLPQGFQDVVGTVFLLPCHSAPLARRTLESWWDTSDPALVDMLATLPVGQALHRDRAGIVHVVEIPAP